MRALYGEVGTRFRDSNFYPAKRIHRREVFEVTPCQHCNLMQFNVLIKKGCVS